MDKRKNTKMKLMMSLSMAIFGTIGLFTRSICATSGQLALYRAVLAVALIGVYLLLTKQKMDFSKIKKAFVLLILSGVAIGFNWVLLFEAYKYTTISMATLSYYFAPVIVTIVSPFLFRERLTKKQIFCFAMSTVGLFLIVGGGGLGTGGSDLLGVAFGLGSAVLYATVVLMNKYIKEVDGIQRTFVQFGGAVAVLAPYVLLTDGIKLEMLDVKGTVCLLVLGFVHTGITYCMYFSSMKSLDGQTVSILSYIDPLVAVLISFFVLGELMTPLQMLGGAMILGFTLYNEL